MRASVSCSQPVRSEFKSLLPNISAYITGRNSRNCADSTCCTRDNLPLPPLLRFFFFAHFYPCSTFPSLFPTSLCRLVQGRVASTSSLSRHCQGQRPHLVTPPSKFGFISGPFPCSCFGTPSIEVFYLKINVLFLLKRGKWESRCR